jgi:TRAP-type C4-dicarboxylate transport system permease small subunit
VPTRILDHLEEVIAGAALIVIVAAVAWGVLTRYVTAQPATWATEVAAIAFAWLVFFGAAVCFRHRAHPAIDMLTRRLPSGAQLAARRFNHLLLLAFLLFMIGYGTVFAIEAWDNPSSVMRVPMTWVYGPVTLGFLCMFLRYLPIAREDFRAQRH